MARRNDIDWEAIERDYRAGRLTIVDVANKNGVSDSQVRAKAKSAGWTRDLTAAIEQRTKEKIATIDVAEIIEQSATESADKSAALIKEAIEQASDVAAGVILKHRSSLRLEHERAVTIESLLDNCMSNATEIKDIATVAQTFKMLVDSKSKLRDQEREAYGLDKDKPADTGLGKESVAALRKLKAALENAD